jgi:hypothetical protein
VRVTKIELGRQGALWLGIPGAIGRKTGLVKNAGSAVPIRSCQLLRIVIFLR